jgi:hypothetical protein
MSLAGGEDLVERVALLVVLYARTRLPARSMVKVLEHRMAVRYSQLRLSAFSWSDEDGPEISE